MKPIIPLAVLLGCLSQVQPWQMQPRGLSYGSLYAEAFLVSQEKPKQVVRGGKDVPIFQLHRREVKWHDRSKYSGAHLRQLRKERGAGRPIKNLSLNREGRRSTLA